MLLMIAKGIKGGICQVTHRCAKTNNKYMKNYDKNNESSYLKYLDANNLYGWAMPQRLPVNGFKWVKNLSQFNEDFIKRYDENSITGYLLELDIEYPKTLFNGHEDLPFLPERKKVEKVEKVQKQYRRQRKIYYSHKSFKTSTKSQLEIKRGTQNNSI